MTDTGEAIRQIIIFPMVHRTGRIRDVAMKMLDKPTDRAASSYRDHVTAALLKHLNRMGASDAERHVQLMAFWRAVQAEMIRLAGAGHRTGGDAA
jgi:hypothetical protein